MNPDEIRFLQTELQRVSPDVLLTGRCVRGLQRACIATLAALESSVAGTLSEEPEVIEALPAYYEFLPGRLPPPKFSRKRKS